MEDFLTKETSLASSNVFLGLYPLPELTLGRSLTT